MNIIADKSPLVQPNQEEFMTGPTITFRSFKDISEFVLIANRYPFHIYLVHDESIFNAKSLLSVFSLKLHMPLTVQISMTEEDPTPFFCEIMPYSCDLQPA